MNGYGIVLGGGGAKGGYEVGVWKALKELGIHIKAVAGTSVGALNGAMMVQNDYDAAYKLWTSINIEDVIKVEKEIAAADENRNKRAMLMNTIKNAIMSRGLDVTPLKVMLQQLIDEEKIRKSEVEFGMVTFSLTDFKPLKLFKEDIPEGQMVDYLLASSCFPAFKTQEIDSKKFIDGGVYDNIPVSLMIEKNIKDIIVVDISGIGLVRRIDSKGLNITYIKNSIDLGGTLSFNSEKSNQNIEIGYLDTLRVFGKLKGSRYYIMPSEDYSTSKDIYVRSIGIDDFKNMYDFLGLEWDGKSRVNKRIVLDKVMRTLKKYSNGNLSGDTVIPAMAEIAAEQIGIDRARVYSLNELIELIIEEYKKMAADKDFQEYIKGLSTMIFSRSQAEFDIEVKRALMEGKFLIFYNPDINEKDDKVKRFRRFIAMTFPRISISNMFIAHVLSKQSAL